MSREEVAMGFLRVANEAMCRPIRALTQVDHKIHLKSLTSMLISI